MATLYAIHNTVRGQATRVQRYAAPVHARYKQHVLSDQRRLVRARPLMVTEDVLLAHLDELKQKSALGLLQVRTQDGRVVDLNTLVPAPAAAPAPLPNRPLDSVANDKQGVGEVMPRFPGDVPDSSLPPMEGVSLEGGPEVPPPVVDEETDVEFAETQTSNKKKGRR